MGHLVECVDLVHQIFFLQILDSSSLKSRRPCLASGDFLFQVRLPLLELQRFEAFSQCLQSFVLLFLMGIGVPDHGWRVTMAEGLGHWRS